MAYMVYLIVVTARTTTKLWDPYDILGVSRVSLLIYGGVLIFSFAGSDTLSIRAPTKKRFPDITSDFLLSTTPTRSALTLQRTKRLIY